eukprot:108462-Rhodomonas_salina.1
MEGSCEGSWVDEEGAVLFLEAVLVCVCVCGGCAAMYAGDAGSDGGNGAISRCDAAVYGGVAGIYGADAAPRRLGMLMGVMGPAVDEPQGSHGQLQPAQRRTGLYVSLSLPLSLCSVCACVPVCLGGCVAGWVGAWP